MDTTVAQTQQGFSSENSPHEDYFAANMANGGRSLNAVWESGCFDIYEKAFLNAIGRTVDFRGDFMDQVTMTVSRIAHLMSCSVRKTQSVGKKLEEEGYVKIQNNVDEKGNKLPNSYRLTWKFFSEEKERLRQLMQGGTTPPGARRAPPLVHSVPISSPKTSPNKESLSSKESGMRVSGEEPSAIEEGKGKEVKKTEDSLEGRKKEEEVKKTENRSPPARVLSPVKPKVDDKPPLAVYVPPTEDTPEYFAAVAMFSQRLREMKVAQAKDREFW
jgi:hypothetical protein